MTNNNNYYDKPALSYSGMKTYMTDGVRAYWRTSVFNPNRIDREPTQAMIFGKLVDCLLCEPHKFDEQFAVKEKVDGRTKEGKAYNEQFAITAEGKEVVNEEDYATAKQMVDCLNANPDYQELIKGEVSFQDEYIWEFNGMTHKAKADIVVKKPDGEVLILDYKTTQNSDPLHFAKDIIKYGYYIQDANYRIGFGEKYNQSVRFIFVVQEKDDAEAIEFYELPPADVAVGKRKVTRLSAEIKARLETNNWKPTQSGVNQLDLPTWFYTQQQEEENGI
jgi:exodeoxyribonuclease VIII